MRRAGEAISSAALAVLTLTLAGSTWWFDGTHPDAR